MITHPNINQSIGVYVVEWEIELHSRIEDMGDGSLTIAIPSDGRAERPLPRGAVVYLDWICERGVVRVRGIVSEFVRIPIPALLIVIDGEPEIHQRRNYVRASVNLAVAATPVRPGETEDEPMTIEGITFDMSGGGMRVRLRRFEAKVDDRLRFEVTLPDETVIELLATVIRRPLEDVYCVRFDQIDKRAQERVVRLVFERLRASAGKAA